MIDRQTDDERSQSIAVPSHGGRSHNDACRKSVDNT